MTVTNEVTLWLTSARKTESVHTDTNTTYETIVDTDSDAPK